MATLIDSTGTDPAFVVERFGTAGDRLEVAGHWRGLRGRRFVRPVLWLHQGESRQRLVAVLDHKPWAADDGEPWLAAFKWDGRKLEAERAELEVGRELVVELPLPGAPAPKPRPAKARVPSELERTREQLLSATKERRAMQSSLDAAQNQAEQLARTRAERDRAREEAEQARADGERMVNDEYRQRERALAAAEEATEARDLAERQLAAAREAFTTLQAERDAVAAQRDRLAAERDKFSSALDRVEAERDAAVAERDRLAASADAPVAPPPAGPTTEEFASAREESRRLERELASAWRERDQLANELAAARAGRERVEAELVAARADRKRLERDRERLESEVATPLRRQARPATGDSRIGPPQSGGALWAVRLVALGLVAILFAAVALLLAGVF